VCCDQRAERRSEQCAAERQPVGDADRDHAADFAERQPAVHTVEQPAFDALELQSAVDVAEQPSVDVAEQQPAFDAEFVVELPESVDHLDVAFADHALDVAEPERSVVVHAAHHSVFDAAFDAAHDADAEWQPGADADR
jgi:hypothetical protein